MLAPSGPRHSLLSGSTSCDEMPGLTNPEIKMVKKSDHNLPEVALNPNPARQSTNLEIRNVEDAGMGQVHIYSSIGKLVYSRELDLTGGYANLTIQTERWQAGMYFLHLQVGDHKVVKSVTVMNNH